MRDEAILRRFGTLNPMVLRDIRLPEGTCSGCGKVHYMGNDGPCGWGRRWVLTEQGFRATDMTSQGEG